MIENIWQASMDVAAGKLALPLRGELTPQPPPWKDDPTTHHRYASHLGSTLCSWDTGEPSLRA